MEGHMSPEDLTLEDFKPLRTSNLDEFLRAIASLEAKVGDCPLHTVHPYEPSALGVTLSMAAAREALEAKGWTPGTLLIRRRDWSRMLQKDPQGKAMRVGVVVQYCEDLTPGVAYLGPKLATLQHTMLEQRL